MNTASSIRVKVATVLLSGLAAGLAGLLLYQSQTLDALPGCGGGSSCDTVLSSRWSLWFGIPVSLMAMMVYTAMLAAVISRDPQTKRPQHAATVAMAACAFTAIAAALWFIGVQVFAIGALCKYCMATHIVGVAASVLCLMVALPTLPTKALASVSAGAMLLIGVLIVGQVLGEAPQAAAPLIQFASDMPTGQVLPGELPPPPQNPLLANPSRSTAKQPPQTTPPTPAKDTAANQPADTHAAPRKVELYGGRLVIDTTNIPIIGNPDAPTVMLILYDYTCHHCRDTRKMLEKTQQKYGDDLAILCLPTPLNSKCNRLVKRYSATNRYACDLAKISLAFWKIAPDKWAQFDKSLYSNEEILTPARSKVAAWKLVKEKDLTRAMNDPWVNQQIARDVSIYGTAAKAAGNSALPMLITRYGVMNGTPRHPLDIDDLIKGKKRD